MEPFVEVADSEQPAAAGDRISDLRLRRIDDLQVEALANPDARLASFGAAKGALLRFGYQLEQVIDEAFEKYPNLLEKFDRVLPLFETHLKIMRQAERLEQMDRRTPAGRQVGGPGKPR